MSLSKSELLGTSTGPAWTGKAGDYGEVSVRLLTGDDYDFIRSSAKPGDPPPERELLARVVVAGLCDETGKAIFGRNEVSKVNTSIDLAKLKTLAGLVQEHGGLGEDDEPGN